MNFLKKLLMKFRNRKDGGYIYKKEMCKKAMLGGLCPTECENCAWNTEEKQEQFFIGSVSEGGAALD